MDQPPNPASMRRRAIKSTEGMWRAGPTGATPPAGDARRAKPDRAPLLAARSEWSRFAGLLFLFADELDGVADGLDRLGRVVGDFHVELFLKSHHQFDDIKTVSAEIVNETGFRFDLGRVDVEMLHYDLLHALGEIRH
jgi:hypothetical protein